MTNLPIDETSPDQWIDAISPTHKDTVLALLKDMSEEEVSALWLSKTGSENTFGFGASQSGHNYLSSVQIEFRKLICGDIEYEEIRESAKSIWSNGKTAVVAIVAAAISAKIGIAIAVLTPVVALLLAATAKLGVNAWCNLPPPSISTSQ